jgi:sialate O-acetylesterase
MSKFTRCGVLLVVFLISALSTSAQFQVSKLFCDHMVMQRDKPVPVWGWGAHGDQVKITFDSKVYTAKVPNDGDWKVELPPMPAGGPYEMTIQSGYLSIQIKDIWMGDVWICSGQSNMEWDVGNAYDAEQVIQSAKDTKIRHFKVPRTSSYTPEKTLAGGHWEVATPESVSQFTAVGYFFAQHLRKEINVPIGLLNTSWGGSRIEPWMRAEVLGMDPAHTAAELKRQEEKRVEALKEALEKLIGSLPEEDLGMRGDVAIWAKPDFDDSKWALMKLPSLWESEGLTGLDGVVWFRKVFHLNETQMKDGVTLQLGPIDDSDITWVNGNWVGGMTQQYNVPRIYRIDSSHLKKGKNVISVRVHDTGGGGGIYGTASEMFVKTSDTTIPLDGIWKMKVGEVSFTSGGGNVNQMPTLLYNKMIRPLIPFPVKGAIWYQGESNASPEHAYAYRKLFKDLIVDWRKLWNVGDFPFLWVQLANFMAPDAEPAYSAWALLRESQTEALALPNTGQAVIIDIGEADDIHPRNKQDVGYRLSLAARKWAYGQELNWSSPVYKSHWVKGNKISVNFDYVGEGLMVKDKYGYVRGFTIAGDDGKFQWARAKLDGNSVIVWHPDISAPVAIRYAWGNNPDDANLYSKEGLPACPFRTDE